MTLDDARSANAERLAQSLFDSGRTGDAALVRELARAAAQYKKMFINLQTELVKKHDPTDRYRSNPPSSVQFDYSATTATSLTDSGVYREPDQGNVPRR